MFSWIKAVISVTKIQFYILLLVVENITYIHESIYKILLGLHIWQNSFLNSHHGLTTGGAVPRYLNKKGRASPGQQPGSAMSPDLQANPQWWGRSSQDVSLLSQSGSGSKESTCSCNVTRAETRAQSLRLNTAPERWGWRPPTCLKAALVKPSRAEAADPCGRRCTHSPDGRKAAPHIS